MYANKRLENCWLKFDKKCVWCGKDTKLPEDESYRWYNATRDHLFHRKDNRRYTLPDTVVLACQECNIKRSHAKYWINFNKDPHRAKYEEVIKNFITRI